jgi:hypothetical protein
MVSRRDCACHEGERTEKTLVAFNNKSFPRVGLPLLALVVAGSILEPGSVFAAPCI